MTNNNRKEALVCLLYTNENLNCFKFHFLRELIRKKSEFYQEINTDFNCRNELYGMKLDFLVEPAKIILSCIDQKALVQAIIFDDELGSQGSIFQFGECEAIFGQSMIYSKSNSDYYIISDAVCNDNKKCFERMNGEFGPVQEEDIITGDHFEEKEKESEKEKDNEKEKEKLKGRENEREKEKESVKEKKSEKERESEKDKFIEKEKGKENEKELEKGKEEELKEISEKEKGKPMEKEKSKENELDKEKEKEKEKLKENELDKEKEKEIEKERMKEKEIEKEIEKENEKSPKGGKDINFDFYKAISEINFISIDNKDDYIITLGKITYTITTTKNQKNQINTNTTTIDLGHCETKLKEEYNISMNESLYIFKIDILIDYMVKIEYEVYYNFSSNNLTKLNLTFCKDIKIDILIPKDIPLNEIDKYNKSSGYYNDICYTLINSQIDETIKDRINDYKKNNMSICEEDCEFTEYNIKQRKLNALAILK